MNIERQYIKQLHEAVSSSYMDNLKKARTLAEEVLLPKLKQFGKDNNVSFEDAKVRMMDSVIVITNFELTKRYGREIITADKNAASMKREKQLISQIKQVVEDFVKDSLVKELHINPDSEIAFEDNHIYIEMAGKGLYEALNQDSTWEQLQSDKSLSPAEKKVVELLPLLNDKSDILALKTAFPNIVNAFMDYEGISESET